MDYTKRTITDHIVDTETDKLEITAVDAPDRGGANNRYEIHGMNYRANTLFDHRDHPAKTVILFQNCPIPEVGVNGITIEALLAVVIDRLRGFQSGPFKCKENACALTHIEEALHWLQQRTRNRIARGVEGTYEV